MLLFASGLRLGEKISKKNEKMKKNEKNEKMKKTPKITLLGQKTSKP